MTESTPHARSKATRTAAAGGAVLTLGAALLAEAPPAGAANFAVLNDDDAGAGSLRAAVDAANAAGGADTITFAPGLGPITLLSEIAITDELTITGPATLSGGETNRIFYISEAGSVTLSGLAVVDGVANGFGDGGNGGAVFVEDTDFTLQSSSITGSAAQASDGGGYGGGLFIQSYGTIDIIDSVISGNDAERSGGGAMFHGGEGGNEGPLVIENSTFDANEASRDGGGFSIYHVYETSIYASTISRNFVGSTGGGLRHHVHEDSTLTMTNSTVSGNETDGSGGGAYFDGDDSTYVRVAHSTVTGNTAAEYGGGLFFADVGDSRLDHTIAGNSADEFDDVGSNTGDEGGSSPVATDFSLITVTPEDGILDVGDGNLLGVAPGLAALADNGGLTQTHALLATSPALDGGNPGFTPPPDTDQRGLPRVQGEAIDIGAYEAQPEDPPPPPAEPPAAQPAEAAPRFTG